MAKVKGVSWNNMINYFSQAGGTQGLERVKQAISPEDRQELFSRPILASTDVDYGCVIRFIIAADRVLGRGDLAMVRQSGIYNARQSLQGVFRFLISFASPQAIINNAARMWGHHFDRGRLEAHRIDDRSGTVTITDIPDIPLHHEISNIAFIEEALRISGCKNPRGTHPACMARGDNHCLFEFTWE